MSQKQEPTQVKAKPPFQRPASTVGGCRDGGQRQRLENDKIQNPEKYAALIQNDGTAGRTNLDALGLGDDCGADYYTERAEEQQASINQIAFRENCDMICDAWDEQARNAGIEKDYDAWDDGYDDFEFYNEQDHRTWGEMLEAEPDIYEDTGFTCGITKEYADELSGNTDEDPLTSPVIDAEGVNLQGDFAASADPQSPEPEPEPEPEPKPTEPEPSEAPKPVAQTVPSLGA